jgi:hypothetical protein
MDFNVGAIRAPGQDAGMISTPGGFAEGDESMQRFATLCNVQKGSAAYARSEKIDAT